MTKMDVDNKLIIFNISIKRPRTKPKNSSLLNLENNTHCYTYYFVLTLIASFFFFINKNFIDERTLQEGENTSIKGTRKDRGEGDDAQHQNQTVGDGPTRTQKTQQTAG